METAHNPNERTPLLGNDAISNEHRKLCRISATSIERTPLEGNGAISDERTPLDEYCSTLNERMSPDVNYAISNEQTCPSEPGPSSISDKEQLISCPRTHERQTNEVSLEEIVQALCSAWQRNEHKKTVEYDYFSTKDLYSMHVAWMHVTRGRSCTAKPVEIAEALADAIAAELIPMPRLDDGDSHDNAFIYYAQNKDLLAANLLRDWQWITDEDDDEFPRRYVESIFEDSNEQPPAVSEYRRRRVDLYDKVHGFILNPKLQVILHSLLFIWHISLLIIGSRYMECSMGHSLSHLLMILGCLGCSSTIVRLGLLYLTSKAPVPFDFFMYWMGLRLIEFTFLIVFIAQTIHFFDMDPTAGTDPNQCVNFYQAAMVINYVSIPLVSVYVFVYIIRFCQFQFDAWHWIFRHF